MPTAVAILNVSLLSKQFVFLAKSLTLFSLPTILKPQYCCKETQTLLPQYTHCINKGIDLICPKAYLVGNSVPE